MVKIKQKKQLNLPQLIEYAWENPDLSNGMSILSNDWENVRINFKFNPRGVLSLDILNGRNISDNILFTLKVEEEIDEDTKLPKSLAIFEHNGNLYSEVHNNKNINDILKMDIKVKSSSTNTIHMVNDDGTHTLIWRDGRLIE